MMTMWINLGALGIVAFAVSAVISVVWFFTSKKIKKFTPAAQSHIVFFMIIFPLAVAGISLFSYWETPGNGHGEHPQLWPFTSSEIINYERQERIGTEGREHNDIEHSGLTSNKPLSQLLSIIFVSFGVLLLARLILMLYRTASAIKTTMATSKSFQDIAVAETNNMWVIPNQEPEAFVLGIIKPKLFVSDGLLRMPTGVVNSVMAHERAHIRRLDPLRYLVVLLVSTFHLPGIANKLQQRMRQIQELSADADAANTIGDATSIAEALVTCTRLQNSHAHLAFGGGDLEERVLTLLGENQSLHQTNPWLVWLAAFTMIYIGVLYSGSAHHLLERLTNFSF